MPEWILQLLALAGGCAAVYGAIRADLARLHERTAQALESVKRAHERIDACHGAPMTRQGGRARAG